VVSDASPNDAAPDAGCTGLVLGGATEDVYVDKGVAQTGDGTKQCPFKTILEATSLPLPAVAVARRTIHVKGDAVSPDYNEIQPIEIHARVTLTSAYDNTDPGGVSMVRILARGDCAAYTGAASAVYCAVAMENDAQLDKVTVRIPSGQVSGNDVLTTNVAPTPTAVAPSIVDVNAENAPESGFRVYGSVKLGPRVNATNNRNGLTTANRALGTAVGSIVIVDAPALNGTPSNSFSSNTNAGGGSGISIFGNYMVSIAGANVSNNSLYGMSIATPYTSTAVAIQSLSNVHMDNNGVTGLRILSGEVYVLAAATTVNTFNNNKAGYGIEATTGDSLGDVRLILAPQGSIAHRTNGNYLGGIHLNHSSGSGAVPHEIASLEARQNGFGPNSAGIFVHIAGATSANQSSLVLRGSTLLQNLGIGLRFQKGSINSLDIGTSSSPGYNVLGDVVAASNRNANSGICFENMTNSASYQAAEYDRWSSCPPVPVQVTSCGVNAAYHDMTYVGTSSPYAGVVNCY
jgi:hypothetical protein